MPWEPHQTLDRITVIVDRTGRPLGATVTRRYDEPDASHQPLPVGPFDTADEVWERCKGVLDIQLTLW